MGESIDSPRFFLESRGIVVLSGVKRHKDRAVKRGTRGIFNDLEMPVRIQVLKMPFREIRNGAEG